MTRSLGNKLLEGKIQEANPQANLYVNNYECKSIPRYNSEVRKQISQMFWKLVYNKLSLFYSNLYYVMTFKTKKSKKKSYIRVNTRELNRL